MRPKRALRRAVAPNVFEAFRELVYRIGVEDLAPLMGLRTGTLYNKADAGDDTHNQPTLRDVVLATQASGDHSVLDALEDMFGRAAYDCNQHMNTSDEDLLALVTKFGAESGEFHQAMSTGLKQRRFSRAVHGHIRAEAFDVVSALMTLVHRLEDLVDEDAAS